MRPIIVPMAFLGCLFLVAMIAALVSPQAFEHQNIEARLLSPSWQHWFGTDMLGRDLFQRVLFGARVSLMVGLMTSLVSLVFGTMIGSISGYLGGRVDLILMRIVELFSVFPSLLLTILFLLFLGNGLMSVVLSLAVVSWVYPARVVRAQVMQIKKEPHVEGAVAMGAPSYRILVRHILPLVRSPLLVVLTYQIPNHVLAESFLSFIGLGLQPPYASWGTLASEGFKAMQSYPHLLIAPAVVLFLTLLAFQFLGDALRDLFDPKTKYRIL